MVALPRPLSRLRAPGGVPHGSQVALATPFADGVVDMGALAALVERQVRRGTAAVVVGGSTGEGTALSLLELGLTVAAAVEVADGRVPVIAGCGASSTDGALALATVAAQAGAAGLLVAPPPYVRPSQDGIVAHVRAVSHATDLPVILYDVPSRTGVAIADATVARLFQCGLITALKDATGDLGRPPRLRASCGAELTQLSGDDATALAYRAMGGHGCISVTANVAPALCSALHAAWVAGDLAGAARLRDLLAPLHDALFLESNPVPLKAALAMLRLCKGDLRLPLTRSAAGTRERLAEVLSMVAVAEDEAAATGSRGRLSLVS